MLIYLLRHADAESYALSDSRRELTAKGIAQAESVGVFCKKHRILPDHILASPFVRTKQTAHLVARELSTPAEEASFLASGMMPATALKELRAHHAKAESIMLVGHEPDLSQLIAHLAGGISIHIRKASLTLVETTSLRPGTGILHFSIPQKFMHL